MRAVLTRVKHASCTIDGSVYSQIQEGFLILLGIGPDDTESEVVKLSDKLLSLRLFEDEDGKMNKGLEDVNGEVMIISQFTLYGNCKKGRRPDFFGAAKPAVAVPLYESFIAHCKEKGYPVKTGVFGADMKIDSLNDGPVTLFVDTEAL